MRSCLHRRSSAQTRVRSPAFLSATGFGLEGVEELLADPGHVVTMGVGEFDGQGIGCVLRPDIANMRARFRAADREGQGVDIAFGGAPYVRDFVARLGGKISEYLFEAGRALGRGWYLDHGELDSFGACAADHMRRFLAGFK